MTDLPSRHDAEDIAAGTPVSGPDGLVERICRALRDTWDTANAQASDVSYSNGYDDGESDGEDRGYQRGYEQAVKDRKAKLDA